MTSAETPYFSDELTWFKSTYSGSEGGDCVEVAASSSTVHIRDSKHPDGPTLTLSPLAWAEFLALATT
ncbi:DUF397 domain-containing protein [Streptomyces sp. NPDC056411]|uniref:DUF397 domain-containing protein n=1 Tax=Streptomyces sp. NPDC056411 TaxID=3345813 RepID=UPI0035DC803C